MKTLIAQLNHVAKNIAEGDISPFQAIEETVDRFMLVELEERDDCRIYEAADGTLVNCWIGGVQSDKIEDGGLGFDDQVAWFLNDLITQAQAKEIAGVTVQAINNAIAAGRLRGYKNPSAKYQRQEVTLVSEAEVRKLSWKPRANQSPQL